MRSSLGVARPANAQTFGVQAGVSLEPNQFYFGGRVEMPPLADVVHVRPNMQWALGGGVTPHGRLNFEFVYGFRTQRTWQLYAGSVRH